MAKKKAAISELIKTDMTRRSIGEEPAEGDTAWLGPELQPPAQSGAVSGGSPSNETPDEQKAPSAPAPDRVDPPAKAAALPSPTAISGLLKAITAQAEAAGLTGEQDLLNFHDFLLTQATRYIRGFNAGRRFHGG
jgi:hypothetical protein